MHKKRGGGEDSGALRGITLHYTMVYSKATGASRKSLRQVFINSA